MTTRSARLFKVLGLVLVVGLGVSLAAGSATVSSPSHSTPSICVGDAGRGINQPHSPFRLAQYSHCHCCGTDDQGHCNHQCCD
jgi:hypothetical protein